MDDVCSIRPVFTMYASLIKNDGTFGGGQSVDGFGRIENSGPAGFGICR